MLRLVRAWQPYVPSWRGNDLLPVGERVQLEYRALTVEDVFRAQEESGAELLQMQNLAQQDAAQQRKQWGFMRHLLVHYTRSWAGVEVDGEPVTTGEKLADAASMATMELVGEVVARIVGESLGTEEEAKNSAGQSVPKSSGSGTTAATASPDNSRPREIAAVPG